MNGESRAQKASIIKSVVFGVEDSLVSTVGLVAGIAIAGVPRPTILLTGLVLIFVEAFSMAVGDFLSEESAREYLEGKEISARGPLTSGLVMFVSYLLFGLVPLAPYAVLETNQAFWASIGASLFFLFLLGVVSAKVLKQRVIKHSLSMLILGGLAVLIGVLVGKIFNLF